MRRTDWVRAGAQGKRSTSLLEDLPAFEPWTSGAYFEPMRSWFDSLLSYERAVNGKLRAAEEALGGRWREPAQSRLQDRCARKRFHTERVVAIYGDMPTTLVAPVAYHIGVSARA